MGAGASAQPEPPPLVQEDSLGSLATLESMQSEMSLLPRTSGRSLLMSGASDRSLHTSPEKHAVGRSWHAIHLQSMRKLAVGPIGEGEALEAYEDEDDWIQVEELDEKAEQEEGEVGKGDWRSSDGEDRGSAHPCRRQGVKRRVRSLASYSSFLMFIPHSHSQFSFIIFIRITTSNS